MAEEQNTNSATTNAGGDGGSRANVSLPGYVRDNLGKEIFEDWSKRAERDPEFVKSVPATLPEFAKAFDSERSQRAEIAKKLKESEEGRKPPNSPTDYGLDKIKLREGTVYDKTLGEAFAKKAHELHLPVKEVQALFDWQNEVVYNVGKAQSDQAKAKEAEAAVTRQRDLEATRVALRNHWGEAAASKLPRNLNALMNPAMMPQDIRESLDKSGIIRTVSFQLWWDRQVSMMSSDRKLSIATEPGEGTEEEAAEGELTTTDKGGKKHLKTGFFKKTGERFPTRKKAV